VVRERAAVAETHSGVVFFHGDRAYKLKKAVDLGFLDFTDRAVRRAVCEREVELNRRLAPDVYLGVLDVVGADGHPRDHLVEMRRLPSDRRLATLLATASDADVDHLLDELAAQLVAFHARAERSAAIDTAGRQEEVRRNWDDNTAVLARFPDLAPPDVVDRCRRWSRAYLAGRSDLVEARIRAGRVVDGHGDLLAEDIFCLEDGPRILDCLEFDDRLRYGDVLLDLAFLAMDLERLRSATVADGFLARCRSMSGDDWPASLADHFVAYRAHVRAKVACLKAEQGDPCAGASVEEHLRLCERRLRRGRVRVVLVGGLPGTGKTTSSRMLGEALGWAVLGTDELRKELAGLRPDEPAPAPFGEGLYRPERVAETYRELLARAERSLRHGVPVVLDASWLDPARRADAARLADETDSELVPFR
jgi:aminoglycoside phosphotransferase family enzyme